MFHIDDDIKTTALEQIDTWEPPDPDGHHIEVAAVPPSEPAWYVATCTACDIKVTSRTSPVRARQLATTKHRDEAGAVAS